ncbi:MAG: tyrosine-type recombinase/integrase [Xanthobacteraceae bacterium]
MDAYEPNRQKLYSSFVEGLTALGDGLSVQRLPTHDKARALISARLERSGQPPTLLFDTSAPPERAHPAVMLRHACGYALANKGHDTRALQAYLGHRNIQHTVRYTELSPTRFKDFWRN